MNENCNCSACRMRARLQEVLMQSQQAEEDMRNAGIGDVQSSADSQLERDYAAAEINLNHAKAVDLLTTALVKLNDLGEFKLAAGVRTALEILLPVAPAEVPASDDVMDELPPQLRDLFASFGAAGLEVKALRFPKK